MIGFLTRKNVSVSKVSKDIKSRILNLEVTIEDLTFILINLYNSHTEPEQVETFYELDKLLDDFLLDDSKNIILAGDFKFNFRFQFGSFWWHSNTKEKIHFYVFTVYRKT